MYGSSGKETYTNSVLNILKSANLTSLVSNPNNLEISPSQNKCNSSIMAKKLQLIKVNFSFQI